MNNTRLRTYRIWLAGLLCCLCLSNAKAVDEADLLPVNEAFQFSLTKAGDDSVVATWTVAEGYYLYKDKLSLSPADPQTLTLGEASYPPSSRLDDKNFGDVEIFRHTVRIHYPVSVTPDAAKTATLKAKYQGCSDLGVCYPPIRQSFQLASLSKAPTITTPSAKSAPPTPLPQSEQDSIAASLASDSFVLTLISFFGFGLLLSFTPCVFPMIPILSGIILGQGQATSAKRAFSLSLVYVLAMAAAYTLVGILAALFGTNLQVWFQNPWVLGSFAGIFVLLALSMFGFYELQMPTAMQSKLNNLSGRQESGKLLSAGVMGFLSALIVGPCVTAPLIGALIYIGQTGNTWLGGSALFALGLGMGAPLLLIGLSAGKFLPRAGAWMEAVKAIFGILMLAVAIWLLSRVLPALVTQLLWASLLIISSIYLGALRQHSENTRGWPLLWKGLAHILLLYGSLLLIGAATGQSNLLSPLQSFAASNTQGNANTAHASVNFQALSTTQQLDQVLADAVTQKQTVVLDFYADWCISCKEMEATTFEHPQVIASLENSLKLQVDVTQNSAEDSALLKRFGLIGPPAILFFNPKGQELTAFRTVGYVAPEKFAKHVQTAFQ